MRKLPFIFSIVAALLGGCDFATPCYVDAECSLGEACIAGVCDDAPPAYQPWQPPDQPGPETPESASCEPVPFTGQAFCGNPMSYKATQAAAHLQGLWGTSPAGICEWNHFMPPVFLGPSCGGFAGNNAVYCPDSMAIAFDADMLNHIDASLPGGFASVVVLAHEWGHLNQHVLGRIHPGGQSNTAIELNADCQAGIFAAVEQANGYLSMADPPSAFQVMCQLGDQMASPFFTPGAHGSCEQRTSAFMHGYQTGLSNVDALCGGNALQVMTELCPI